MIAIDPCIGNREKLAMGRPLGNSPKEMTEEFYFTASTKDPGRNYNMVVVAAGWSGLLPPATER